MATLTDRRAGAHTRNSTPPSASSAPTARRRFMRTRRAKARPMSSPDRKTRIKGNRVMHTPKGGVYKGDAAERPRGLTTEQAEDQRRGTKIDERQRREAVARVIDAPPHHTRTRKDETTSARKAPARRRS